MYSYGPSHMTGQKQDDQHELTYSNYVRTQGVTLKTCRRRWIIGRSGERGSGISLLAARHDDDDDDDIYSHPETVYSVVSQLFSVANYVGLFNLESKSAQLYVRFLILPLRHQATCISSGIIRHYVVVFVCLHFAYPVNRVCNSFEELCITRGLEPWYWMVV